VAAGFPPELWVEPSLSCFSRTLLVSASLSRAEQARVAVLPYRTSDARRATAHDFEYDHAVGLPSHAEASWRR
jgi:hypothetical protein